MQKGGGIGSHKHGVSGHSGHSPRFRHQTELELRREEKLRAKRKPGLKCTDRRRGDAARETALTVSKEDDLTVSEPWPLRSLVSPLREASIVSRADNPDETREAMDAPSLLTKTNRSRYKIAWLRIVPILTNQTPDRASLAGGLVV